MNSLISSDSFSLLIVYRRWPKCNTYSVNCKTAEFIAENLAFNIIGST